MEKFHIDMEVSRADATSHGDPFGLVEAPRDVIAYIYPKHDMKAFDAVGYLNYQGMFVVEEGKKDEMYEKLCQTHSKGFYELGLHK